MSPPLSDAAAVTAADSPSLGSCCGHRRNNLPVHPSSCVPAGCRRPQPQLIDFPSPRQRPDRSHLPASSFPAPRCVRGAPCRPDFRLVAHLQCGQARGLWGPYISTKSAWVSRAEPLSKLSPSLHTVCKRGKTMNDLYAYGPGRLGPLISRTIEDHKSPVEWLLLSIGDQIK